MDDKDGDSGRRTADRRKMQQSFTGEDRRKNQRRSGKERRTTSRHDPKS